MKKDIGRPLFFIIVSLIFFAGLGSVVYQELIPIYIVLIVVSMPILILIAVSKFLAQKKSQIASAKLNIPTQKKNHALIIIVIVLILYFIALGI